MDQIKKLKVGSTYYSLLPEGGTSGQVLKKNSATNFDVSWGSAELEVEEVNLSSSMPAGSTKTYNIVLVDGGSQTAPFEPQTGNVITGNGDNVGGIGLGVRVEVSGGSTLFCDSYRGNVEYSATYIPSGKVLIGSSNNFGTFRSTTQDIPASTSVTSYTSDYIVGGQALFKATERYITFENSITSINASYNVGHITTWWGNSTPSLGFSQFPSNKHITIFIVGELTGTISESAVSHNFIIPATIEIGSDKPTVFVNGVRIDSSQTITILGNTVLELDAYYVVNGSDKQLIIRYA